MGRAWRVWTALVRNPLAVVGALIVLVLVVMAIFAPLIAPYSPVGQDLANRLMPPSAEHWMGTDELGRDIYSRVVYGARITLLIVTMVARKRAGERRGLGGGGGEPIDQLLQSTVQLVSHGAAP